MAERRGSLGPSEVEELKKVFDKQLKELVEDEGEMTDLIDFTVVMIQNGKSISEMEQELDDIYGGEYAKRISSLLTDYFKQTGACTANEELEGTEEGGSRIVSLKSSSEGNALTMSGALGASRERGKPEKPDDNKKKKRDDSSPTKKPMAGRGGRGDRLGGRGDRRSQAFERLTSQESRDRRDNRHDHGGRGRSRGRERENRADHDGRGRPGRMSGRRRQRDDDNKDVEPFEEHMPVEREKGSRGPRRAAGQADPMYGERGGRSAEVRFGRGGRPPRGGPRGSARGAGGRFISESPKKRQRVESEEKLEREEGKVARSENEVADDEYYDESNQGYAEESYEDDGYYDVGYDGYHHGYYNQGYSYGGRYGGRGGRFARGRGRFRAGRTNSWERGGRGHGGRFNDYDGGGEELGKDYVNNEADMVDPPKQHEGANGEDSDGYAQRNHPSPMVAATFGGRDYRGRGRGFYGGGRGRGRGRGAYRAPSVAEMLASKTWVRKKDGDNAGASGSDAQSGHSGADEAAPEM